MKGILRCKRLASDCNSGQYTTAPDTMLTGNLKLEWEIPSRSVGQDIREWMLVGGAATLKDGIVHLGRCENEVIKFYGSVGSHILEGVVSALESPAGVYKDSEFEITTSPDLLECSYATMDPEFLSTLKLTLSWICLSRRNEIKSHIALSTGSWVANTFCLNVVDVADWHGSVWTKAISHAMVVCLDQIVPKAPLLSTVFPIACQLGAVHTPLYVEHGLIYHGGFNALVPIELRKDGSILWEIEMKWDDFLYLSEIKCMKRRWYQRRSWFQTLDHKLLQSAPALIR